MRTKTQPITIVMRTNFLLWYHCNEEVTYARALEKRCFCVYFQPLLQLCLPLTNKIAQKWPTTSHRRWYYTSWNEPIFRTDTHTCLFYNITIFHTIWYTPWCLL